LYLPMKAAIKWLEKQKISHPKISENDFLLWISY
jgi:hypothetical protein